MQDADKALRLYSERARRLSDAALARTVPGHPLVLQTWRHEDKTVEWEGDTVSARERTRRLNAHHEKYILGSFARSEGSKDRGSGAPGPLYAWAFMNALYNEFAYQRSRGKIQWSSPEDMLVSRHSASHRPTRGKLGRQPGRWGATARPPRGRDVVTASLFWEGAVGDYTRGAHRFYDTSSGGFEGFRKTVEQRWYPSGWRWVGQIPGINPYHLLLLRKDVSVSLAPNLSSASRAIELGRKGDFPKWTGHVPVTTAGNGITLAAAVLLWLAL